MCKKNQFFFIIIITFFYPSLILFSKIKSYILINETKRLFFKKGHFKMNNSNMGKSVVLFHFPHHKYKSPRLEKKILWIYFKQKK